MKLKHYVFLGLLVVANSLWISYEDSKYIIGPYGKKKRVYLSEPIFAGDDSTSYSIRSFRYRIHRLSGWDNLSNEQKEFIDWSIRNYEYGYSYSDGDELALYIVACYQIGVPPNKQLTQPIPRSD